MLWSPHSQSCRQSLASTVNHFYMISLNERKQNAVHLNSCVHFVSFLEVSNFVSEISSCRMHKSSVLEKYWGRENGVMMRWHMHYGCNFIQKNPNGAICRVQRVLPKFRDSLIPPVFERKTNLEVFLFIIFKPKVLNLWLQEFPRLSQIDPIYLQARPI